MHVCMYVCMYIFASQLMKYAKCCVLQERNLIMCIYIVYSMLKLKLKLIK